MQFSTDEYLPFVTPLAQHPWTRVHAPRCPKREGREQGRAIQSFGQLNMRILHETGSRRLPEIDLCINTSATESRPLSASLLVPPRRFSLLLSLFAVRLCVSYRIVKPLFSVRTAGQKESSCLRLLVNRVSRPGDSLMTMLFNSDVTYNYSDAFGKTKV